MLLNAPHCSSLFLGDFSMFLYAPCSFVLPVPSEVRTRVRSNPNRSSLEMVLIPNLSLFLSGPPFLCSLVLLPS